MKNTTKTWDHICKIPAYLIQEISDNGTFETYDGNVLIDSDDLRISIILSGGHQILLPPASRILLCDNGDMIIEALR